MAGHRLTVRGVSGGRAAALDVVGLPIEHVPLIAMRIKPGRRISFPACSEASPEHRRDDRTGG